MRGRKPKPTALKVLQGNPGKRALPTDEPTPTGIAEKPEWLRSSAAKVWDEYAPKLIELGLLSDLDAEKFGQWCSLAALFRRNPTGMPANKLARMDAIASQFGMDPSSRTRLGGSRQRKDDNPFRRLTG